MADFYDEDYEFDGYRAITLFDNEAAPKAGAKLKFEIQGTDFGDGEAQSENIVDEVVGDGALTIQCDMTKVVHGTLTKGGPPATLIVFQLVFLPRGNNHRFKSAEIIVTFSSGKVHSISPDNEWRTLPSEKQQERTHTVSPSIEATLGPAKATTAYTWQSKETETIKGYARVTGAIISSSESRLSKPRGGAPKRRKNTVCWGVYENEDARTGIPSLLVAAVVLEREPAAGKPHGEPFSAAITIHGHVDRRSWIKEKWESAGKRMTGGTRKGKDIVFHPPTSRGAAQHPESLENEDLDLYRQLIAVREWNAPGETPPAMIAKDEPNGADQPLNQPLPTPNTEQVTIPLPAAIPLMPPRPPENGESAGQPIPTAPVPPPAATTSLPAHPPAAPPPPTPGAQIPRFPPLSGSAITADTPATHSPLDPGLPPTAAGRRQRAPQEDQPSPGPAYNATAAAAAAIEPVDDDREELPSLSEQLRLVRAEAGWAVHVIGLLGEERRLVRKMGRLQSRSSVG